MRKIALPRMVDFILSLHEQVALRGGLDIRDKTQTLNLRKDNRKGKSRENDRLSGIVEDRTLLYFI